MPAVITNWSAVPCRTTQRTKQFAAWCKFLGATLLLPLFVAAAASGGVRPAALPALALVLVCATPAILLFAFCLSFLFATKEQAGGFYVGACIFTTMVPTTIAGSVDDATLRALIGYFMLFSPINQLIAGLQCILWITMGAAFTRLAEADDDDAAGGGAHTPWPSAGDYFCLTFTQSQPGVADPPPQPGPLLCALASLLSIVVYGGFLYYIDLRLFIAPLSAAPPPGAGRATPPDEVSDDVSHQLEPVSEPTTEL